MLKTSRISKSFGSIQALSDVAVEIDAGAIFGIAGPNGAGKSTLFNVIAGVYPPTGGQVYFQGRDITRLGPHRICRLGLARTFQVPKTFPTLSVYDNIRVGATFGNPGRSADAKKTIDSTLKFLGIEPVRDTVAANLDLYTTKLVGLAMALATDCKLLMLDEPLAGLAINEIENFLAVVLKINKEGAITILMIEHILDALIDVSDRMLVLDNGEVIYRGAPEKVTQDQRVIDCYLGSMEA